MTGFYNSLANCYHLLFPARGPQLTFLTELAGNPPARLIDVASGTGEYVTALGVAGFECLGVEIDYTMWMRGRELHPEYAHRMFHGDMLELMDEVRGPAALAFCIGNSLPHLASDDELAFAIGQMWDITRPGGKVALQVVNFDRVLANTVDGSFSLPTLDADDLNNSRCILERHYSGVCAETVRFNAALTSADGVQHSSLSLLTLTRARIAAAVPDGIRVDWFGDFTRQPWAIDSPATITVLS